MLESGIALDEHFDFQVDNTGDVKRTHSSEELQKDLALRAVMAVEDVSIGSIPNANAERRVRTQIQGAVESDPRVDRVQSVTVDTRNTKPSISASVTAIVDNEQISFSI